jgi:hypothetical protein
VEISHSRPHIVSSIRLLRRLPRILLAAGTFLGVCEPAMAAPAPLPNSSSAPNDGRTNKDTNESSLLPFIEWDPYRRFALVDGFLTVGFATASVAAHTIGPRRGGPTNAGGFDEFFRDALKSPGVSAQHTAATLSNILVSIGVSYALVGDPLVNAAWLRESPDAGWQLAGLNAEALAITSGVQQLTANLVGRERPYGRTCGSVELNEKTYECDGGGRYQSHFSGHTSLPFSIAATTCVSHIALPLSGGKAWLTCTSGFVLAATTGILRIVSDHHYATDVLVGAAAGSAIGIGLALSRYRLGVPTLAFRTPTLFAQFLPGFGGLDQSGRPAAGLTVLGVLH